MPALPNYPRRQSSLVESCGTQRSNATAVATRDPRLPDCPK